MFRVDFTAAPSTRSARQSPLSADLQGYVLDSLDVAVCAVDCDLRVTLVNPAWDAMMRDLGRHDRRAGHLLGRRLLDILDGAERDQWAGICMRLLDREEASYWTEFAWPLEDSQRWVALTARTLFDDDGAVAGISFMLADTTEQKLNAEEALKRRVELRGLFEMTQSVGTISDTAELFRRVTGHLAYLFGAGICVIATRDQQTDHVMTRAPAHGLGDAETSEFALPPAMLAEADAGGPGLAMPSYLVRDNLSDGSDECRALSQRWNVGSLLIAPLRNQGRVLGYLILADSAGCFDDEAGHLLATFAGLIAAAIDANTLVLALKDRADKLSAALAEIQELDRLKDELVQNVSHELRLPLMVIQGYADLLKMGAFGAFDSDLQQAVEVISDKAALLGKRVGDIVLLRDLQRADLQLEPVSLAALAREALERARPRAAANQVVLTDDVTPETTPLIADRWRMEQVIDELLDNAIKFSPDGGEVRVAVREGSEVVYLKVSDQGIGIPPSQTQRIWDRFYQFDGSTRRRFGGSGVGLAVVKQIVDAHSGQVWVESREEGGSHFYVALRRTTATARMPQDEEG